MILNYQVSILEKILKLKTLAPRPTRTMPNHTNKLSLLAKNF